MIRLKKYSDFNIKSIKNKNSYDILIIVKYFTLKCNLILIKIHEINLYKELIYSYIL